MVEYITVGTELERKGLLNRGLLSRKGEIGLLLHQRGVIILGDSFCENGGRGGGGFVMADNSRLRSSLWE